MVMGRYGGYKCGGGDVLHCISATGMNMWRWLTVMDVTEVMNVVTLWGDVKVMLILTANVFVMTRMNVVAELY